MTTASPPAPFWSPVEERRLRVLEQRPAGSLLVHEIYVSVQGESTYVGRPCTFVRLTGCPFRCRWCDSPHAFAEGSPMTVGEIVAAVEQLPPRLVELTGGEPLAHPEALLLLTALADAGRELLLETSGGVSIAGVDPRVVVVMDLKCPSSGEEPANKLENLDLLKPNDEVKFVVGDRADFDWAADLVVRRGLFDQPLLFSPVFGELPYVQLVDWVLGHDRLGRLPKVRFQLQLHKHVWDPKKRGV
ncbi:MAG: radical SAM protein [Planctomycetia bacterium]